MRPPRPQAAHERCIKPRETCLTDVVHAPLPHGVARGRSPGYFLEMVLQTRFLSALFAGIALGFAGEVKKRKPVDDYVASDDVQA